MRDVEKAIPARKRSSIRKPCTRTPGSHTVNPLLPGTAGRTSSPTKAAPDLDLDGEARRGGSAAQGAQHTAAAKK